jgi:ubiquinone/menaquinone biosynthesis C-methylase UbiE
MYQALAQYYDLFMNQDMYQEWAAYLFSLLQKEGIKKGCKGVDLACGSGRITTIFKKEGYDIFGVDKSQEMLRHAAENARKEKQSIVFVCEDMQKFSSPHPLDFAICNCDGVNYLKNPEKFFENVALSLKKNGVFIFDISSEHKLFNILANNIFSQSKAGVTYIWKNFLCKAKGYVDMELCFFDENGEHIKKSEESSRQYIHNEQSLLHILDRWFFTRCYYDFSQKGSTKKADRVHFVAVKK